MNWVLIVLTVLMGESSHVSSHRFHSESACVATGHALGKMSADSPGGWDAVEWKCIYDPSGGGNE